MEFHVMVLVILTILNAILWIFNIRFYLDNRKSSKKLKSIEYKEEQQQKINTTELVDIRNKVDTILAEKNNI